MDESPLLRVNRFDRESGRPTIPISTLKFAGYRKAGNLNRLTQSIIDDGLKNPILVASDRTIISGERRAKAYLALGVGSIPYQFVTSVSEYVRLTNLEAELRIGHLSKLRSEIGAHVHTVLDARLTPVTHANGRSASPIEMFCDNKTFGMKHTTTLTSLVLLYRTAHYGFEEDERREAWRALEAMDGAGSSLDGNTQVIAGRLRAMLKQRYGGRIEYNYIEKVLAARNGAQPKEGTAPMTAGQQREIIERFVSLIEGASPMLTEIGPLSDAISHEDVAQWVKRLRDPRVTIEAFNKTMRGRIA